MTSLGIVNTNVLLALRSIRSTSLQSVENQLKVGRFFQIDFEY